VEEATAEAVAVAAEAEEEAVEAAVAAMVEAEANTTPVQATLPRKVCALHLEPMYLTTVRKLLQIR